MRLKNALTIADLKVMAKNRVPKMFFDYADSGSLTEQTYAANESDYAKILLRQKIARKLSNRSLKTTMIGQDVNMPLALAPVGMSGMQHANGEILAAKAAKKAGIPYTLSTMSICSIEDVAKATNAPFWFQLYVMRDHEFVRNLLDRAKAANVSALVLTMDLQILAQRHKDLRNGLTAPPKFTPKHVFQVATRPFWALKMLATKNRNFGNIAGHVKGISDLSSLSAWTAEQFDLELTWDSVAWIKDYWGGKLIIKGILDADDAKSALKAGADAIIVSNHGGRQLDGAPSSIRVLPQIVAAVGNKVEIHIDGGIRNGQDILKAKALGAQAAYIGRPYIYGLGAGAEAGVTRTLDILRSELDSTMALCGERNINNVGAHNIYSNDLLKTNI
jgi:L-lactate dehydrogenase (cytochrome)